jgi:diguanylate cyclase (GGDEF)-like protein
LLNRYAFDEIIEDIKDKKVSIGMSDMDSFKRINDKYGHIVGDKVLRQASQLLIEDKPEVWCFRYGGDEFLFITERDEKYLREVLENWSKKIEETKFEDIEETVTVSVGVTNGIVRDAESVRELVKVADSELYTQKKNKL